MHTATRGSILVVGQGGGVGRLLSAAGQRHTRITGEANRRQRRIDMAKRMVRTAGWIGLGVVAVVLGFGSAIAGAVDANDQRGTVRPT
jgi:hypothetical protein